MARLRQSLSGRALESIRGLGVTAPEYEEAKEILKSKYGGQRRQLRAYLDELEKWRHDLVRVTVVKLKAQGKEGKLGDGTLHSLLIKKLTERLLESYTRWLSENSKVRSVIGLRDWLREEIAIRVEAVEMAYGLDNEDEVPYKGRITKDGGIGKKRSLFTGSGDPRKQNQESDPEGKCKPPCEFCGGSTHGIWSCRSFQQKPVETRWGIAKEKQLCFRCLGEHHRGKDCRRSQSCNQEGCKLNHHRLLHRPSNPLPPELPKDPQIPPREGATPRDSNTATTQNLNVAVESCSLCAIPVWLKANGKKVKVNAIMDDASNGTFLNEEIASLLGVEEPFQKVQVHVLNSAVETFQSMPIKVDIESVSGEFRKTIEVKTCPRKVTGTYKVEDWNN